MRVLIPPGLFEELDERSSDQNPETLGFLSDQIFNPKDHGHSIFLAEDFDAVSRIVAAFSLQNPERLQPRAVAWGAYEDLHRLSSQGKVLECRGDTPDAEVSGWHRDLIDLTGDDRRMLVGSLFRGGRKRWKVQDVERLVAEALSIEGRIDRARLRPGMWNHLLKKRLVQSG